jgi:predicted nucleotide-binding protein
LSRIDPNLFRRLLAKIGKSERRVYALIEQRVRDTSLPPNLAAITLAADYKINIARYSTPAQLAEIRAASRPTPAAVTATPVPRPLGSTSVTGRKRSRPRTDRARIGSGTVFVVHGRDNRVRSSLFSFLRSIGLKPLEWRKALEITKKPSPYIGEVLDAAFERASAVVVLLTPDDEARLRLALQRPSDPAWERELVGQARPNVLFEAGMAFGSHPTSTVLVTVGELRPFSDIAGRHVVHLTGSPESRIELITKLRNCGCTIDDSGSDWLTAGEFTIT